MKARLYLLRHAKSDWGSLACTDFDRPLNDRGREGAQRIGRFLHQQRLIPAHILCSGACRARETLLGMLSELPLRPPTTLDDSLYLASPATILSCISQTENSLESLMVIAHNPGIQELSEQLVCAGEQVLGADLKGKYPTAGLAILQSNLSSWRQTAIVEWKLEYFVSPRKLG